MDGGVVHMILRTAVGWDHVLLLLLPEKIYRRSGAT